MRLCWFGRRLFCLLMAWNLSVEMGQNHRLRRLRKKQLYFFAIYLSFGVDRGAFFPYSLPTRHVNLTVPSRGGMPEWLKGADCKSAGYAYVGSNPTPSTTSGLLNSVRLHTARDRAE
ncbi:hypothetical protein MTBPR1_10565 [Candidatus Terasakiella magnetica]|uniref:Uncharacterized protein n=1 Tax=Candidatus Terasakiella magnetica TaxID=1867952 RepID=A0A1C3RDJ5_9PROT|nr:hypothetical protein MTBPR1_10565 [Candidatus Terasakiella magnetica]